MPQHKRPFPHPPPPSPARAGPASKLCPSRSPVESSTKGNHKLSATGIPDDSTNRESALGRLPTLTYFYVTYFFQIALARRTAMMCLLLNYYGTFALQKGLTCSQVRALSSSMAPRIHSESCRSTTTTCKAPISSRQSSDIGTVRKSVAKDVRPYIGSW